MGQYVELYILINLFCSGLLLVFVLHSRVGMGATISRRYFVSVIFAVVIFFLSDSLWFAMDHGILPPVWWISALLNNIYFLAATFSGYLWVMFILTILKSPIIASRRNRIIAFIPVLIHIALCIYNYFDPILFGTKADLTYFRGPLYMLQYVIYYLYMIGVSLYTVVKAFQPENYVERSHYLLVAMFPILPVISGTLQLFYTHIPFNCMAFTLNLTVVYMNELSQQVSLEPLTQLANRKQFMRTLDQAMQAHEDDGQLYLFMMDLDLFKSINDTYGHSEGDNALVQTSEALRRAIRELHQRVTLARYGGDEFAIIATFENPADVQKLKNAIQREMDVQNSQISRGYQLRMSVGVAQYTPEMHGFKALLDAADEQLFAEKRKNKQ